MNSIYISYFDNIILYFLILGKFIIRMVLGITLLANSIFFFHEEIHQEIVHNSSDC